MKPPTSNSPPNPAAPPVPPQLRPPAPLALSLDGQRITRIDDLKKDGFYVAAGAEKFKSGSYNTLSRYSNVMAHMLRLEKYQARWIILRFCLMSVRKNTRNFDLTTSISSGDWFDLQRQRLEFEPQGRSQSEACNDTATWDGQTEGKSNWAQRYSSAMITVRALGYNRKKAS